MCFSHIYLLGVVNFVSGIKVDVGKNATWQGPGVLGCQDRPVSFLFCGKSHDIPIMVGYPTGRPMISNYIPIIKAPCPLYIIIIMSHWVRSAWNRVTLVIAAVASLAHNSSSFDERHRSGMAVRRRLGADRARMLWSLKLRACTQILKLVIFDGFCMFLSWAEFDQVCNSLFISGIHREFRDQFVVDHRDHLGKSWPSSNNAVKPVAASPSSWILPPSQTMSDQVSGHFRGHCEGAPGCAVCCCSFWAHEPLWTWWGNSGKACGYMVPQNVFCLLFQ